METFEKDSNYMMTYNIVMILSLFLANLNLFKYLRINENFSGLFRLLGGVISDILVFLTVFIFFTLAFIQIFYIYQIQGFRVLVDEKTNTYE